VFLAKNKLKELHSVALKVISKTGKLSQCLYVHYNTIANYSYSNCFINKD